jgi:hypothetical protein
MRRLIAGLGLLAFAGCASSMQLEREAREHQLRAEASASARDYNRAAAEKREAERLHAKAVKKSYKEGNAASVEIPTPPQQPPPAEPPTP